MKSLRRSRGFTLIEVMIVIVICIILASLAWPAYQEYKRGQTFDTSTPPITSDTVPFKESYSCDHGFLIKSNGQPHTIDGNAIKC